MRTNTRENATQQSHDENTQKPQQTGPYRLLTVASAVESLGRGLGMQNRPLYGEMMQTLIPLALWEAILGHFELSHAHITILG